MRSSGSDLRQHLGEDNVAFAARLVRHDDRSTARCAIGIIVVLLAIGYLARVVGLTFGELLAIIALSVGFGALMLWLYSRD